MHVETNILYDLYYYLSTKNRQARQSKSSESALVRCDLCSQTESPAFFMQYW